MTIQEAKQKVNSKDPAIRFLLKYIDYLEDNYKKIKQANEAHREQVGGLYKQIDER